MNNRAAFWLILTLLAFFASACENERSKPLVFTSIPTPSIEEGLFLSGRFENINGSDIEECGFIVSSEQSESFEIKAFRSEGRKTFRSWLKTNMVNNAEYKYRAFVRTAHLTYLGKEERFVGKQNSQPVLDSIYPNPLQFGKELTFYGKNFGHDEGGELIILDIGSSFEIDITTFSKCDSIVNFQMPELDKINSSSRRLAARFKNESLVVTTYFNLPMLDAELETTEVSVAQTIPFSGQYMQPQSFNVFIGNKIAEYAIKSKTEGEIILPPEIQNGRYPVIIHDYEIDTIGYVEVKNPIIKKLYADESNIIGDTVSISGNYLTDAKIKLNIEGETKVIYQSEDSIAFTIEPTEDYASFINVEIQTKNHLDEYVVVNSERSVTQTITVPTFTNLEKESYHYGDTFRILGKGIYKDIDQYLLNLDDLEVVGVSENYIDLLPTERIPLGSRTISFYSRYQKNVRFSFEQLPPDLYGVRQTGTVKYGDYVTILGKYFPVGLEVPRFSTTPMRLNGKYFGSYEVYPDSIVCRVYSPWIGEKLTFAYGNVTLETDLTFEGPLEITRSGIYLGSDRNWMATDLWGYGYFGRGYGSQGSIHIYYYRYDSQTREIEDFDTVNPDYLHSFSKARMLFANDDGLYTWDYEGNMYFHGKDKKPVIVGSELPDFPSGKEMTTLSAADKEWGIISLPDHNEEHAFVKYNMTEKKWTMINQTVVPPLVEHTVMTQANGTFYAAVQNNNEVNLVSIDPISDQVNSIFKNELNNREICFVTEYKGKIYLLVKSTVSNQNAEVWVFDLANQGFNKFSLGGNFGIKQLCFCVNGVMCFVTGSQYKTLYSIHLDKIPN